MCIVEQYLAWLPPYRDAEENAAVAPAIRDVPIHERKPPVPITYPVAYDTTSVSEYLAEASQAMCACHGHYPWNRNKLWRHDTYMLIWNAWHDPPGFCPHQPS